MGLDDYVAGRLERLVAATLTHAGHERLHLLGHCLGGTLATILAARDHAGRVASLINLTVPIGFHDDGMLSTWTRAPLFDPRAFAEAVGDIPPWITQPSFNLLRPLSQPVKTARLWQHLGDESFLDFFWCMETWVNDNVAIPKRFYVDLIERLYRANGLAAGTLAIEGAPVELEALPAPVLTVCADKDHIVPLASATCGHPRYAHPDSRLEQLAGGHIGVVVGGRSRRIICPLLDGWLRERSEEVRS